MTLQDPKRLEVQIQWMRETIAGLKRENEEMKQKLREHQRTRVQAKALLVSIDRCIIMQIGKLNSRWSRRVCAAPSRASGLLDPKIILFEIKKEDIASFYDQKRGIAAQNKRLYSIAIKSYRVVRRAAFFLLRLFWRGLKLITRP
jgi:hypothetical protein